MTESNDMNCEQAKSLLFELIDGSLSTAERDAVHRHLDDCADCSAAQADVWHMQMVASRWKTSRVPRWNRRDAFFESRGFPPLLQIASACASVVVMVLVLAQVRISTEDGFQVSFGGDVASRADLEAQLHDLRQEQVALINQSADRLTNQQVASNQLMFRTLLEASRQERHEDLRNLVSLVQDTQTKQNERTAESLRYVLSNQIEDRRNIQQLGQALKLVASDGGTL